MSCIRQTWGIAGIESRALITSIDGAGAPGAAPTGMSRQIIQYIAKIQLILMLLFRNILRNNVYVPVNCFGIVEVVFRNVQT